MGGKQERKPFDADAVRADSLSSLAVLLNWLRGEGNYARWRGTNRLSGNTKEDLCREIMHLFHSHGLLHRTTRDVRNKMAELERSMSQALAWKEKIDTMPTSGGDVMGAEETRASLLKCCKLYDVLAPVMGPLMPKKAQNSIVSPGLATQHTSIIKTAGQGANTASNITPLVASNIIPPLIHRPLHAPVMVAKPVSPDVAPLIQHRLSSLPAKKSSPPLEPVRVRATYPAKRSLGESGDCEQHTPQLERTVKKNRLRLEARRLSMEDERLKMEIDRQQIQLAKEKALARQELRKAQVPEDEIRRVLPYE